MARVSIARRKSDGRIVDASLIPVSQKFLYSGRVYESLTEKKDLYLRYGKVRVPHFAEMPCDTEREDSKSSISSTLHNKLRDIISTYKTLNIGGGELKLTNPRREKQTIGISSPYPISSGFNSSIGDVLFDELIVEVICSNTFSLEKQTLSRAINIPFFILDMSVDEIKKAVKAAVNNKDELKAVIEDYGTYISNMNDFLNEAEESMMASIISTVKQYRADVKGYVLRYYIGSTMYYIIDKRIAPDATSGATLKAEKATVYESKDEAVFASKRFTKYPPIPVKLGIALSNSSK